LSRRSFLLHLSRGAARQEFDYMLTFRVGLACLALAAGAASSFAAEVTEVVVTANRITQSLDQAIAATQIITREQIQESQARTVDELLRGAAGFSITNSGGQGKLSSFMVRGAEADHLVVLLDGIRLGSATAGTVALQNIPLELIDRIEIVRGPRSSLYGSEAIGGVMQIFTRREPGVGGTEVSATGGSYGTRQLVGAVAGGSEALWFNLAGSRNETSGFDACRGSGTLFRGCFTDEPDRDGLETTSASASVGTQIGERTSLRANILRSKSDVEYDGSFGNNSQILQQAFAATATHRMSEVALLTLRAGRAWDKSNDYQDNTFQSKFVTTRDSASLQLDLSARDVHQFSAAVDFQADRLSGTTAYDVNHRRNVGVLAQYAANLGAWHVEASARRDESQQFGQHQTGAAAIAYSLSDALQLSVQYGTAFKAPTFNELYYPQFGNSQLEPERSASWEFAAKGRLSNGRWRVSLFDTKVDQLVALDENFVPENIDAASIRGAEFELLQNLGEWQVQLSTTYLKARNTSDSAARGNALPRRPRMASHIDVQRSLGSWRIGMKVLAEGARFDDAANTERTAAFGTVDLRVEWAPHPDWVLQGRIANLMDKRYETIAWYNQPGRAAYATLRYSKRP
jgi:vitamin B12 transporter